MTLKQLKCLCAVADCGFNVSRAAALLHMTQPGVSKMISAMERELALEIFVRRGNRLIEVTERGRDALALARRIMSDRDSLIGLAKNPQSWRTGTITIGTTPLGARRALLDPIKRFTKLYPSVDFEITYRKPHEVVAAVASGELDMGLSPVPDKIPSSVVTFDAYPIDFCLITPNKHPLTRLREVTIQEIANYPLVSYSGRFNSGSVIKREFQRLGLAPRITIKTADTNTIKAYVAAGLGVGVVVKMAIDAKDTKRDSDITVINVDKLFPKSMVRFCLRRADPKYEFIYDLIHLISPRWPRKEVEKLIVN